jgi:hypothetical protein
VAEDQEQLVAEHREMELLTQVVAVAVAELPVMLQAAAMAEAEL